MVGPARSRAISHGFFLTTSMLAPEDRPAEHARVMKVVQNGASKPASAESEAKQSEKIAKYEDDYQEGDDTSGTGTIEDDGWDVVPSKKKSESRVRLI